jgi:hypothetical protein
VCIHINIKHNESITTTARIPATKLEEVFLRRGIPVVVVIVELYVPVIFVTVMYSGAVLLEDVLFSISVITPYKMVTAEAMVFCTKITFSDAEFVAAFVGYLIVVDLSDVLLAAFLETVIRADVLLLGTALF